jgi:hypothetical protein
LETLPCSWVGRTNIVNIGILLKIIHKFYGIPVEILITFFTKIGKEILELVWEHKAE